MFVAVDMKELQFVHKHRDHEIVSSLTYLEACDRDTLIDNTERPEFLIKLTPLELRLLYRNTTGIDITGTDDIVVREMLAQVVDDHIDATLANQFEVDKQIAEVIDDLEKGIPWAYSLGASKPAKQEELFSLHCKALSSDAASLAATRAPQRRATRAAPKPRAVAPSPPQPAPARKQRAFSVRPIIWEVADRMWQEAGSPKDKAVVLELRKQMMAYLESDRGIKRTSSSNELGNWMKERLAE